MTRNVLCEMLWTSKEKSCIKLEVYSLTEWELFKCIYAFCSLIIIFKAVFFIGLYCIVCLSTTTRMIIGKSNWLEYLHI